MLRVSKPHLVVDVGCGTGALVIELARRGIKGLGVDSSPVTLGEASARSLGAVPAPDFRIGSVEALPVEDGEADVVTMIEVIEHLDDETLGAALSEARRVLAAPGTLMITTPNREDLTAGSVECPDCGAQFHVMQHVRRWTAESLGGTLERHGFGKVSMQAVRLVENGPLPERLVRAALYRVRPLRPRLLAIARRG